MMIKILINSNNNNKYIYIYGCLIGFQLRSHEIGFFVPSDPRHPRIAKAMTRKTKAKAKSPTSAKTWPQTKTNAEILVTI